jgi:hypothetical protein
VPSRSITAGIVAAEVEAANEDVEDSVVNKIVRSKTTIVSGRGSKLRELSLRPRSVALKKAGKALDSDNGETSDNEDPNTQIVRAPPACDCLWELGVSDQDLRG